MASHGADVAGNPHGPEPSDEHARKPLPVTDPAPSDAFA